ncbi:MAG: prepilin peptidase [Candidatus Magasanikiibacteriota bacterium]
MLLIIFILGSIFGSFLNAVVYRIHEKKSLWERSECPNCHKQIKWYDNVPILSFLILKGKCRNCKQKISWQYPLVELVMGILFVIPTFLVYHANFFVLIILLSFQWLIIFDLAFIFLYDLKYQEILELSIWPLAILLFLMNASGALVFTLIGIAIGGGFFLLQYLISKGKWIGGGDIRLGILMGIILGWKLTILALFVAYLLGGAVGSYLLITKKKEKNSEIAFGTFLVIGTLVSMWWGDRIVNWYLGFLS